MTNQHGKHLRTKSFIVALLISLSCFTTLLAHVIPRTKITGAITDSSTGQPLYFADVFLHNTSMGTATDAEGRYSIDNVPMGSYDLVVRMIGYGFVSMRIHLNSTDEKRVDLSLRSEPIQAPLLRITAKYPRKWKRNLQRFRALFLGKSRNARKCTLVNSEILNFAYDDSSRMFTTNAAKPLKVRNLALGYMVDVHIQHFRFDEAGKVLYFHHNSRFDPLRPENEREAKRWRKNRVKAYNGSRRHFIASLMEDALEKDGYEIYLKSAKVEPGELLLLDGRPYENVLSFSGYLKVIFTKEPVPAEFRQPRTARGVMIIHSEESCQISRLALNQERVTVNALGHIYEPYGVTMHGYWTMERFAEALPMDYEPGE